MGTGDSLSDFSFKFILFCLGVEGSLWKTEGNTNIPEHCNENEFCPDKMLMPASQALL